MLFASGWPVYRYLKAFLVRSSFALSLLGTHFSSITALSSLRDFHGLGQPYDSPLADECLHSGFRATTVQISRGHISCTVTQRH